MQQSSSYAPSRRRSPNHSDSESEQANDAYAASTSGASSSTGLSTSLNGSGRPQRPGLTHATTQSGSFIRIKRKNTSPVQSLDINHASGQLPGPLQNTGGVHHAPGQPAPASNAATAKGERTVDELTSKTCFICYEEENEESRTGRKWVHPCKCSLVAHEDCILSWITVSKPTASQSAPVKCPQCNTPYTIAQKDYKLLRVVEKLEEVWAKNVSKIFVFGIGAGVWTLLSKYGIWALRTLAGQGVSQRLLQRPSTKWIIAPLLLPVLVLSRTHVLDPVLPFLPLVLVINSSLDASSTYPALEPYSFSPLAELQFSFPPNPALTLCLIPWIRAVYMAVRRRVFRAVLGRPIPAVVSPASPAHNQAAGAAGQPVHLPGAADFAREHQQNLDHNGEPEINMAALNILRDGEEPRRYVMTIASGARLLGGSLLFPAAAALTGSLLLWIAKRQNSGRGWLAWALGVGAGSTAIGTPVWNFSSFLPAQRDAIDPVWWRSTVGGALLVLLKDSWSMARQVMERKRAASRRIESQAVRDGLEI